MLALSLSGVVSGSIIILMGRRQELKEKLALYFIGFVIILQILSIFSNQYDTQYFFILILIFYDFYTVYVLVYL